MSEAKKDESGLSALLWRDIGSAPKDSSSFLAFEKGYGTYKCYWDKDHDGGRGGFRNPHHGWNPSHWMPFPKEP